MTQRVTFLVAFDLPARVDVGVARKALQETIEAEFEHEAALSPDIRRQWGSGNVIVTHHPTVRRGE